MPNAEIEAHTSKKTDDGTQAPGGGTRVRSPAGGAASSAPPSMLSLTLLVCSSWSQRKPSGVGGCPQQACLVCRLHPVRRALREEGPQRRQEQEQQEERREAPAEEEELSKAGRLAGGAVRLWDDPHLLELLPCPGDVPATVPPRAAELVF